MSTTSSSLPSILLQSADGAQAEIFLQGAHVTRWIPAGRQQSALFLSDASEYREGVAIRGGVPVVFPQFANEGPLVKHGFVRGLPWQLTARSEASARLELQFNESTLVQWPHRFALRLDVSIGGPALKLELSAVNIDAAPFSFTTALHTYLRVPELELLEVQGLQGLRYHDKVSGRESVLEAEPSVRFGQEVDRIYLDAPAQVRVSAGMPLFEVQQQGFSDTVVWNPGREKSSVLKDMEPDGYRRMVCVEAASIGMPVVLEPGVRWSASQTLIALS